MKKLFVRLCHGVDRRLAPVYRRWPAAHKARQRVSRWRHEIKQTIQDRPALDALTARRFEAYAVASSRLTAAPSAPAWPSVDVSVVLFNSARWLPGFMQSLAAQQYPLAQLHLCLVDHGSTDGTVALAQQLLEQYGGQFASVQLIEQDNLGFGAGHHRAIQSGHSDYCLVTNVDLEFEPQALCLTMRMALSDTQAQVASWELRQAPYEHPKYYDAVTLECNWSSHACILLRRSAYEAVGGYEPRIFMYCEDVELSYRFRSYGYTLKYVPQAVVQHYTYESAGEVKPLQYAGGVVGSMYLRLRYGTPAEVRRGLGLYGLLMLRPQPFAGARAALWQGLKKLMKNWAYFKRASGKGSTAAHFSFYGLDYEVVRDGAFWDTNPLPAEAAPLPLVSIITRTYQGRDELLRQTIQSVLHQSYEHLELIVVEDGGSHQQAVVEQMAAYAREGQQLRFIPNPKEGRSSAGNAGLAAAQGRWLLFLDDDDLLFADHVETLVQALLQNPDCAAAYALSFEIHTLMAADFQHYTETRLSTPPAFYQPWDYSVLQHHNFMPIQSILFQRELYEKWGGFDVELDQLEDWHLWLRYGHGQQFAYVAKTTSLFRSPANPQIRLNRTQLLHEAYEEAKARATLAVGAGRAGD